MEQPVRWRRTAPPRPASRAVGLSPALLLLLVVTLDVLTPEPLLGLVVIAPLFAASVVGPRPTAAYGVAALVAGTLLGVLSEQYSEPALVTQLTRLSLITLGGVLAVATSVVRVRRETRLTAVLRVADAVQRAVLPAVPDRLGSLRLVGRYDSAASEASVGGDLYAAVDTPFGVRLLVGDVRGKGLDAVRLMSVILGAYWERAGERNRLSTLLADLDAAVRRVAEPEDFVTAVVVQVDTAGRLELRNAGHPPPLLLRAGRTQAVEWPGGRPPLGLDVASAGAVPDEARVDAVGEVRHVLQLHPADRILLYTDGLTEARHRTDGTFFPLEESLAATLGSGSLADGVDALHAALLEWVGGSLDDDVALLAAEVAPGTDF